MSTIERMTIQGIRSYGPKDKDTQRIDFFTPVTLIVGQNGCGKTTIIESLKYATTSDMPPNTKGTSFLFDPKLIDEIETKAKIALFFRDTSGLCVQVQKNLCSTQKLKKLEFRTLETIITRYNAENKIASTITSKCINADAEVVNAFGVSKAVLEHVIFCHQEDSNWPLSDGKLLKTRFDEIFAATKYIKALDILKKVRLEKTHLIKQVEIEKKHLENYKRQAEDWNRELEIGITKRENAISKKEALDEKLKPIESQIDKYLQESNKIFQIKNEMDKIINEKKVLETQMKDLIASVKDCLFTGTEDQLLEIMDNFKNTTIQMLKEDEEDTKEKQDYLNDQLKELNAKRTKYHIEIGEIESKMKILTEKKKNLADLAKKICKLIKFDANEIFDDKDPNSFDQNLLTTKLQEFIEKNQAKISSLEKAAKIEEENYQNEINEQRDEKSKLDQNILIKQENILKAKQQLDELNGELHQISDDKVISSLNSQIDTLDSELVNKSSNLNDSEEIKTEIKQLESKQLILKQRESELDTKISKFHLNSKFKTEIDLLYKDKKSKEDQTRKIKIHIQDDMDAFFEDAKIDVSNLKSSFETRLKKILTELSVYKEKQKEIDKRSYSHELKRKTLCEDLRNKETKLRDCEDKLLEISEYITSVEDINKYEEIYDKLAAEHEDLVKEKGFLNGVDKTYNRFLVQLQNHSLKENSESSCPICMRCFKSQDELDDTIKELRKSTSRLPGKISDLEVKIESSKVNLERMISLKSDKQLYDKIKNVELNSLRNELENYDKNILPKLKSESKANEEQIKRLEKLKTCSEILQNEIVLIDKYSNECKDLEKKIKEKERNSVNIDSNEDLEQLESEKESTKTEIDSLNRLIKEKQNEISKHYDRMEQINKLKEKINSLNSKKNDLQLKFQKKSQLIEKRDELLKECQQNEGQIKDYKNDLNEAISNLNRLIEEKKNKSRDSSTSILQEKKNLDEIKSLQNRIREAINDLSKFESGSDFNIDNLKKELKLVDKEEKKLSSDIAECTARLDDIKTEIARHDLKQREFKDNLDLMRKRSEYLKKEEEYKRKQEELPTKNLDGTLENFKREQRKAELKRDELMREKADVKVSIHNLDGRIDGLKNDLNVDVYKNALENYLNCAADLRVLEISVQDIEKYYKALDKAIMNYHSLKMNEINKTIKQLWRQVYRGNDIDYIEIRSEEDAANAEQAVKTTRRTYNYRVVLIKGDTCMDMRGRCSAGQKVLASIIIRLSLAENFCLNSGILALDEPTTNLDRENIESLASALVEIIKTRSNQKNFQLIIITHDEDFVEMLGRSEYMDQFYRVQKDDKGLSRIFKRTTNSS